MLCLLEGGGLIAAVLVPHGIDDAHPYICQCSHSHTMTFAFTSFAFVVSQRPPFLFGRLPRELMQYVAQWFQAGVAFVGFGVIAALECNRCCPCQGLHTRTSCIARAIIAPFRQQSRRKPFACSWKTAEDFVVLMGQKKVRDLFVIRCDLLNQRQELSDQCQHQPRLRAGRYRIGV